VNNSFWLGFEKQANSMSEIAGGLGHAAGALKTLGSQAASKAKTMAHNAFTHITNQPGTAARLRREAEQAGGSVGKKAAKPQPSFLTKARIYGKGAVAGGVLTGGAIGLHSMAHSANQGAMQPMQQGYY